MRKISISTIAIFAFISLLGCEPLKEARDIAEVQNTHSAKDLAKRDASYLKFLGELKQNDVAVNYAAHWLKPSLLLVDEALLSEATTQSKIKLVRDGEIEHGLVLSSVDVPKQVFAQYPHLKGFKGLTVSTTQSLATVKQWLKSPLTVVVKTDNKLQSAAHVQAANLIDAIYGSAAQKVVDLGSTILPDSVQFKLWAPTASKVNVLLFNKDKSPASPASMALVEDETTGVWQGVIAKTAEDIYYRYQIRVFHPKSQRYETLTVTDPYSLSLSTNSEFSHVVDLNDARTLPKGWSQQQDNTVENFVDNVFYETHIRDFSAHDETLSDQKIAGKYAAYTEKHSAGIQHLKALRKAGVNNIHLLPTFDLGTINENADEVISLDDSLSKICKQVNVKELCESNLEPSISLRSHLQSLPTDDDSIEVIISQLREFDNYNWGYDPFHYTVPEGSYANNPEASARIVEFREMVQAIHNLGFRVIMDVVYNHTHQAGLAPTAILDKIVPNYYHRLDPITGDIAQSTCCDNTATERVMMEKLMIDSLVVWARDYKIDGFRFDLMAHQPKDAMLRARAAVLAVDPDNYFYGEGWNFGEVANNQRFVQASQLELGGTQIGTFTDRLRDAVRGGAFNATGKEIRRSQGIGNGLGTIPNELQSDDLSQYYLMMDQLRIGLAANLEDFPLLNAQGEAVTGKDVPYGDQPTGYAQDPADTINYVSKHDNQTLWDNNQYRVAYDLSTHDRVRMQLQSLAFPIFAQGIPFLHMGSELLRSKSFLRDSYDYSDWFNKVDFTMQSNNYNVGLPPKDKDQANWSMIKELLAKNEGRDHVSPNDIEYSANVFFEMLSLRQQTPLFRLTSAAQIIEQVTFHNVGPEQQIGIIAMHIKSTNEEPSLMVVFNTNSSEKSVPFKSAEHYQLHPILQQSVDERVRSSHVQTDRFVVPALTTAVFIQK